MNLVNFKLLVPMKKNNCHVCLYEEFIIFFYTALLIFLYLYIEIIKLFLIEQIG